MGKSRWSRRIGNVQVVAAVVVESISDGTRSLFSQPMGICVENKKKFLLLMPKLEPLSLQQMFDVQ